MGPWREVAAGHNATSAFAQLAELEAAGIAPAAWIWIHAQNEKDAGQRTRAAERRAWVSLDAFRPSLVREYVEMIAEMKAKGLLHRVLVSQDAGWYSPGKPRGGDFTPFDPVFASLVPALRAFGFEETDIDTLLIRNPAAAFSIRVRRGSQPGRARPG